MTLRLTMPTCIRSTAATVTSNRHVPTQHEITEFSAQCVGDAVIPQVEQSTVHLNITSSIWRKELSLFQKISIALLLIIKKNVSIFYWRSVWCRATKLRWHICLTQGLITFFVLQREKRSSHQKMVPKK